MKRSTDLARAAAAAALAVGACSRTPIVEAPVVASDGGAPVAVASARPDDARVHAAAADLPFDRGERFTGYYICAQGRTELTLVIEDIDGDDVDAIFEFTFAGSASYGPAEGSYRMRGTYEPRTRTLRLDADSWIDQAPGYQMVNLVGNVSPSRTISGRLSGAPGCSTFSVSPTRRRP